MQHAFQQFEGNGRRIPPNAEASRLVEENLPRVNYLAWRMIANLPFNVEISDLVSEGVFGLMDAAKKFNPSRGIKFRTYAEKRIKGAMLDSLRNQDPMPRSLRQKAKQLKSANDSLEQRFGRSATQAEVASEMGMALKAFHTLENTVRSYQPTGSGNYQNAPLWDEDEISNVAELSREDSFTFLYSQELRNLLAKAIGRLPKKERLVVSLYYYDEMTMSEIGAVLDIKESMASQYHTKAKARLLTCLSRLRNEGKDI